jgi:hypothetical protein
LNACPHGQPLQLFCKVSGHAEARL